jgi:hypothetical protein
VSHSVDGYRVEFASNRFRPAELAPKPTLMIALRHTRSRARRVGASVAALVAAAVSLGGCGTPAVIKPSSTPLPGLERDIHAAQSAVAQTQREAQSDATSNIANP